MKIAFIGFGNLAKAIHNGLKNHKSLEFGYIDKNRIDTKIRKFDDINKLIHWADYVFLTIKPQDLKLVLEDIQDFIRTRGNENVDNIVFISPAAGVNINYIENYLGKESSILRIMPNLAIQYNKSVTAYCSNKYLGNEEDYGPAEKRIELIIQILTELGRTVELAESDFDLFTALYGSGPAFILKLLESFMYKSLELGLPKDQVYEMVIELMNGTSSYMENNSNQKSMRDLISKIASKGGTTEAGLNYFDQNNISNQIDEMINKAKEKSEELSKN